MTPPRQAGAAAFLARLQHTKPGFPQVTSRALSACEPGSYIFVDTKDDRRQEQKTQSHYGCFCTWQETMQDNWSFRDLVVLL